MAFLCPVSGPAPPVRCLYQSEATDGKTASDGDIAQTPRDSVGAAECRSRVPVAGGGGHCAAGSSRRRVVDDAPRGTGIAGASAICRGHWRCHRLSRYSAFRHTIGVCRPPRHQHQRAPVPRSGDLRWARAGHCRSRSARHPSGAVMGRCRNARCICYRPRRTYLYRCRATHRRE
jgi:hypothetical protein